MGIPSLQPPPTLPTAPHSHVPDILPSFACFDRAVNVVFFGLLSRGKHVICHETVYGPSRSVLEAHYTRFGVDVSFVDTSKVQDVEAAIKDNTVLIYLESPANPTVTVSDIPAICKVAQDKGVRVCVDNTFLGPCLQTPLDFGADIVINSLTKSINGHADVVAGCLVTKSKELAGQLRAVMITLGACLDPNSAFLTRRGLKTLASRATPRYWSIDGAFSPRQPRLPCLSTASPHVLALAPPVQHEVCKRIMKGPGTMMSFGLKGGIQAGRRLLDSVKLCTLAVSLGGVETLIQHPASMTHAKLSPEARCALSAPQSTSSCCPFMLALLPSFLCPTTAALPYPRRGQVRRARPKQGWHLTKTAARQAQRRCHAGPDPIFRWHRRRGRNHGGPGAGVCGVCGVCGVWARSLSSATCMHASLPPPATPPLQPELAQHVCRVREPLMCVLTRAHHCRQALDKV
jgi:cystathionine beta-lyase/cystathionine gamma-synthase